MVTAAFKPTASKRAPDVADALGDAISAGSGRLAKSDRRFLTGGRRWNDEITPGRWKDRVSPSAMRPREN
eukprot:820599-Pyramimonas_sp.AAC.1